MRTLTFSVLGLGLGAVYGAVAMGVVLVRRATGVVNLAHGAMAVWAALVFMELRDNGNLVLPLVIVPSEFAVGNPGTLVSMLIAVLVTIGIGLASHFLIFEPIRNRPAVTKVVASIGLMLVLQTLAMMRFGLASRGTSPILPSRLINTLGWRVPADRLILAGMVLVMAGVLWAVYRFTNFGRSTVAAEANEKGAVLLGLSPARLSVINWIIASSLAALFGILACPFASVSPTSHTVYIVSALAAALAARFKSFPIAVVVAMAFGCFEALSLRMVTQGSVPSIVKGGFDTLVPLIVIVVALYFGGHEVPERGALIESRHAFAPVPKFGRYAHRVWIAFALCTAIALLGGTTARFSLLVSLSMGLLVLSVVVLTGFVGQVSLAEVALAGVSAFACAGLVDELGIAFPLGPIIAIVGTTLLGAVLALPALRIRGVQLTVVTLAFAYSLTQLLFRNPQFVGADGLARVKDPELFGINVSVLGPNQWFFVMCVVVMVIGLFVMMANLRRGATGRRMLAVRANERAAAACGINVRKTKLLSNTVASFVTAVAGATLAYRYLTFSQSEFPAITALQTLALAYLGGVGAIGGAVIGAIMAPSGLYSHFTGQSGASQAGYLLNGIGLILVCRYFPGGMIEAVMRLRRRWTDRARPDRTAPEQVNPASGDEIELIDVS